MNTKIQDLYNRAVDLLVELEPVFKHHRLTLVARNTSTDVDNADIIISNDDLDAAARVLVDHDKPHEH